MEDKFRGMQFRALSRPAFQADSLRFGGVRFSLDNKSGYSFEVGRTQLDHLPYTTMPDGVDGKQTRLAEFNPHNGVATMNMGQWLKQRLFSILTRVDDTRTTIAGCQVKGQTASGYLCWGHYTIQDLIQAVRNTMAAYVDPIVTPQKEGMKKSDLLLIAAKEGPEFFSRYINFLLAAFGQEMLMLMHRRRGKRPDERAIVSFNCSVGLSGGRGVLEAVPSMFVDSGAPWSRLRSSEMST